MAHSRDTASSAPFYNVSDNAAGDCGGGGRRVRTQPKTLGAQGHVTFSSCSVDHFKTVTYIAVINFFIEPVWKTIAPQVRCLSQIESMHPRTIYVFHIDSEQT